MLILTHPNHLSQAFFTYDTGTSEVTMTHTHPSEVDRHQTKMPLAQFLREIGIPFRAVRAVTRGESLENFVGNGEPVAVVPGD